MLNDKIISQKKTQNSYSFSKNPCTYINSTEAFFVIIFADRVSIWQSFSLHSFSEMFCRVVWWKMTRRHFLSIILWNLTVIRRVRSILSYRASEYCPLFIPALCSMCQTNCTGKEESQLDQGSFHTFRNIMFSFRITIRLLCTSGTSQGCFNMVQK